jgi:glutamyl-tRNA reductase
MAFAVVGVDHTTCPVAIRERVVLDEDRQAAVLNELVAHAAIDEAAILNTCARTEIYLFSDRAIDRACEIARAVLAANEPAAHAYICVRKDVDAVRHLFRVASGLESQVLGEQQIAGQVRASFESGQAAGTVRTNLDALFRAAIQCSRRARNESNLGRLNLSIATAAVETLRRHAPVGESAILVIGAGQIAKLVVQEVREARRLVISNRTMATAQVIAQELAAETLPLSEAIAQLHTFDVVFCATSAIRPVLQIQHIASAAPLIVFDLAVPRNVEAGVEHVPGVTLYDVDAISPSTAQWDDDVQRMESVIEGEVHDFMSHHLTRRVAPIIASLRDHVDYVRAQEMARIATHLNGMEASQRAAVESLTQRLIDKMFHHLVIRLKLAALTNPTLVEAAEFFFAHGEDTLFPQPRFSRETAADKERDIQTKR